MTKNDVGGWQFSARPNDAVGTSNYSQIADDDIAPDRGVGGDSFNGLRGSNHRSDAAGRPDFAVITVDKNRKTDIRHAEIEVRKILRDPALTAAAAFVASRTEERNAKLTFDVAAVFEN